ncbi:Carboxypeptidase regulatory-like domain-containing protein [Candidatus Electrothrix laxa]
MANQRFLIKSGKAISRISLFKRCAFASLHIFAFLLNGCATPTTLRVLDAETKRPIGGAVALAEWTSTGGFPGLSHTDTAKVAEDVSDSEGKLTIPGAIGFNALRRPHIKVYKPGYVGWDSRLIYLDCYKNDIKVARLVKRKDFSMKDQDIFLEPWDDDKHSYISHGKFIDDRVDFSDVDMSGDDSKYRRVIDYEIPFRVREHDLLP